MADERARLTGEEQAVPAGYRWADLAKPQMEGLKLEEHYRETLRALGQAKGMLGLIFRRAQIKIQDPAKLRRLVVELVDGVSRLCAMNLLLHGIGPDNDTDASPITTDDAWRVEPSFHADVVLTNPPFGKKSTITVVNEDGENDPQEPDLQPRRLLDHHLQETAELRATRQEPALNRRQGGGGGARQRGV